MWELYRSVSVRLVTQPHQNRSKCKVVSCWKHIKRNILTMYGHLNVKFITGGCVYCGKYFINICLELWVWGFTGLLVKTQDCSLRCVGTVENSYGNFGGDFCLELHDCPFKIRLPSFSESSATSNNLQCTALHSRRLDKVSLISHLITFQVSWR